MKNTALLSLTATQLKWIACISMLIDHIGVLLFPQNMLLRGLGRLAFPIFAFMTANACRHTSNIHRYLLRLALFAIGYQPIYHFCMGDHFNIFATLFLGAAGIHLHDLLLKRFANKFLALLPSLIFVIAGKFLPIDYGAYGIALIISAYLFYQRPAGLILSWGLINAAYVNAHWPMWIQAYALLSLPLILLYKQERGKGSKWVFYIFYCLHIPLLYLIGEFLL